MHHQLRFALACLAVLFLSSVHADGHHFPVCTNPGCRTYVGQSLWANIYQIRNPPCAGAGNVCPTRPSLVTALDGLTDTLGALPEFSDYIIATPAQVSGSGTAAYTQYLVSLGVYASEDNATYAATTAASTMETASGGNIITPIPSYKGNIEFLIVNNASCTANQTMKGKYLSTRLWLINDAKTFSGAQVAQAFKTGYGPTLEGSAGFQLYGAAVVNKNFVFFWNIFDTQTAAQQANSGAAAFQQNHADLSSAIFQSIFTEGPIDFAYPCQFRAYTPAPTPTTAKQESGDASALTFSLVTLFAVFAAMLF